MTHSPESLLDLIRQKLYTRDTEWSQAASAGRDIEKIVSYWTDDAIVIPPRQPVIQGKAAIRAFVADSLQISGFSIRWSSDPAVVSHDGTLAYMQATNVITVPGPDGLFTLHGRAITVWRVDSDGEWRCAVDIWNEAPSLPG